MTDFNYNEFNKDFQELQRLCSILNKYDNEQIYIAELFKTHKMHEALKMLYTKDRLIKLLTSCAIVNSNPVNKIVYENSLKNNIAEFVYELIHNFEHFQEAEQEVYEDQITVIVNKYLGEDHDTDAQNKIIFSKPVPEEVLEKFQLFYNVQIKDIYFDFSKISFKDEIQKWHADHILIKDLGDGTITTELIY